jgi:chromosome segregation ATPase
MAFTKTHPQNSWESEHTMLVTYITDTEAHLNSLQAQLDEVDTKIAGSQTVINLLEGSKSRHEQQEVAERKRFQNQMIRTKQNVQKAYDVVESRLARFKASLVEFPTDLLKAERKLAKARADAVGGRVPDKGNHIDQSAGLTNISYY